MNTTYSNITTYTSDKQYRPMPMQWWQCHVSEPDRSVFKYIVLLCLFLFVFCYRHIVFCVRTSHISMSLDPCPCVVGKVKASMGAEPEEDDEGACNNIYLIMHVWFTTSFIDVMFVCLPSVHSPSCTWKLASRKCQCRLWMPPWRPTWKVRKTTNTALVKVPRC